MINKKFGICSLICENDNEKGAGQCNDYKNTYLSYPYYQHDTLKCQQAIYYHGLTEVVAANVYACAPEGY